MRGTDSVQRSDYDLIVIGGGPCGCAAAREVAARGFRVLILEEHSAAGEPLQCSGLISPRTLRRAGVSAAVVRWQLCGARIHAPGGEVLQIADSRPHALAVDRIQFDRELAELAQTAGAELWTGCRAQAIQRLSSGNRLEVRYRRRGSPLERRVQCRLLIGADGPQSLVARWLGAAKPSGWVFVHAAEVELPGRNDQLVDVFLNQSLAPGWFAWGFPVGPGRGRLGLGFRIMQDSSRTTANPAVMQWLAGEKRSGSVLHTHLDHLRRQYPQCFSAMRIIQGTSGWIPLAREGSIIGSGAMLVGDAAGQTKPLSGGGLYLGLEAAGRCAQVAVEALHTGDCSLRRLNAYQQWWEQRMAEETEYSRECRDLLSNLNDQQLDRLIRIFNRPYWRQLILKHADFDRHALLAKRIPLLSLARTVVAGWIRCSPPARGMSKAEQQLGEGYVSTEFSRSYSPRLQ